MKQASIEQILDNVQRLGPPVAGIPYIPHAMRLCVRCNKNYRDVPTESIRVNRYGDIQLKPFCSQCKTIGVSSSLERRAKKYNVTGLSIERLWGQQKQSCAICEKPRPIEKLHIDHCHNTGKVRGVLCNSCNMGLGAFKDNTSSLRRAALYLEGQQ